MSGRLPHLAKRLTLILAMLTPVTPALADLWATSLDPKGTQTGNPNYNKVFRYDLEGGRIEPDIDLGPNAPYYPYGIAVGPDGSLYVSSFATAQIKHYDGQTGEAISGGVFSQFTSSAPAQLTFGPDGNVYVSEFFGTNVVILDPDSGEQIGVAASELNSAGGLAFLPNGDLLVGDGFAAPDGGTIYRVHEGTKSVFVATGTEGLATPSSIFVLPDGRVLAVNLTENNILSFDQNGQNAQVFAEIPPAIPDPLPDGVQFASNNPSDIEFDERGNLIVSLLGLTDPDDNRGALLRYSLDGVLLETIVSSLEPVGAMAWTPSLKTLGGDYDNDNDVDQDDYIRWKDDFGKWVAAGNGADGNGDGFVNAADYTVWRNNLSGGQDLGHAAGVPEPSAGLLAVVGFVLALGVRSKVMFRN